MSKIMLAEDDTTMLSLLKTLLHLEGFVTTTLNEQENVLDALRRENPDAILMDVHLTQGNGLSFMREIRSDPALQHIYAIMQSGMNLTEECKDAGADAFLLKPYMPDSLIQTIRNGLTNNKSK